MTETTPTGTTTAAALAMIEEELARIVADKGTALPPVGPDTLALGGPLPIDSLDLATLLVVLEQRTGCDPFRAGFRQFQTLGELAALYAEAGVR